MNKFSSTKKNIISLFLSIILVTGTIALSYPSFMINVQGQQSYTNNYYKSNDDTNVNVNKIKCINDNININGVNSGNVNAGKKGVTEEGNLGAYSSNIDKGYYNDKKASDCLVYNKNTNTNTVLTGGNSGGGNSGSGSNNGSNQTTPPNPPVNTETLTVIKNVACQADPAICEQNPIVPSQFNILVEGNNPSQNSFTGLSTGTDVELEAGQYNVTEQGLDVVTPEVCTNGEFEAGRTVAGSTPNLFICTNFSDGCEGEIAIGNPQICTIENVLIQQTLDLAVANLNSASVSILLGTGTGSFGTPATNFTVGNSPRSVAVGDFNNDTNLDLAVANFADDDVSILLGTGTGSFTPASGAPFSVEDGPFSLAVGNFNGDTFLDLAVANQNSNTVSILLGTGTGSFSTPAPTFAAGNGTRSVAVGDFNNDTNLDLAIANFADNDVSIFLGTGTGSFGTPATNFGVGEAPQSVAVGDFNNDTNLDLAVANFADDDVSILLGTGTGSFTPASGAPISVEDGPFSLAVGDFNGDTFLDLAVANSRSHNVSILLGTGTGSFVPASGVPIALGRTNPLSVAVGDFNGDTFLDLAVAIFGSNSVSILLGTGTGSFGTPATNFAAGNGPSFVAVGNFN